MKDRSVETTSLGHELVAWPWRPSAFPSTLSCWPSKQVSWPTFTSAASRKESYRKLLVVAFSHEFQVSKAFLDQGHHATPLWAKILSNFEGWGHVHTRKTQRVVQSHERAFENALLTNCWWYLVEHYVLRYALKKAAQNGPRLFKGEVISHQSQTMHYALWKMSHFYGTTLSSAPKLFKCMRFW